MNKRKYRYFSTIEKEEAWLNKQLKKRVSISWACWLGSI